MEARGNFAALVAGREYDRHVALHQLVGDVEDERAFDFDVEQRDVELRLAAQQLESACDAASGPDDLRAGGRQRLGEVQSRYAVVLDDQDQSSMQGGGLGCRLPHSLSPEADVWRATRLTGRA